jgi:hypothetical protein
VIPPPVLYVVLFSAAAVLRLIYLFALHPGFDTDNYLWLVTGNVLRYGTNPCILCF